jgi:hypothetical protein
MVRTGKVLACVSRREGSVESVHFGYKQDWTPTRCGPPDVRGGGLRWERSRAIDYSSCAGSRACCTVNGFTVSSDLLDTKCKSPDLDTIAGVYLRFHDLQMNHMSVSERRNGERTPGSMK